MRKQKELKNERNKIKKKERKNVIKILLSKGRIET